MTPFVEGHQSVNQNLSQLLLEQFFSHFVSNKLSPSQISLYLMSQQRPAGKFLMLFRSSKQPISFPELCYPCPAEREFKDHVSSTPL